MLTLARNQKDEVNKLWLDTVLCLIGEAFDHSDEICGAVVNVRTKGDKICKRSYFVCLLVKQKYNKKLPFQLFGLPMEITTMPSLK